MPRLQKNDNFIDKTFTVLADIILKILPTSKEEKQAFSYYRDGMSAQSEGEYAEALEYYYQALMIEEDPFDRSYILYNIGLIYGSNGEHIKSLQYYHQAIELNTKLPQAFNNIAVIYHYQGLKAANQKQFNISKSMFEKAAQYWEQAIYLAPNNYIEAQNWLKTTGHISNKYK
uniref:Photosystem I assembly protein Ycf3 n=1 Tax=Haraldiophyllum bonnemaisonii TaxID=167977 RepID=A0A4D6WTS3_9FLOR|nr:photosystem I assembly protein Ycf3 [Haraldiophyllum bonnemaisonii]